jgi:mono/diheme cytochrome c family protein
MRVCLLAFLALCLIVSVTYAAGDVAKGKALFNDPKLGGSTAGKSCGSCHPEGKGLEKAADKKEFTLGGKIQKSLEEAINVCIVNANKGKAMDTKSDQMKDMVAYIKSLQGKAAEKTKEKGK